VAPDESREFEAILSTFNPWDISIVKSLLDGEGIVYYNAPCRKPRPLAGDEGKGDYTVSLPQEDENSDIK